MDAFELRRVQPQDLDRGYFDVLGALTVAPPPSFRDFAERIELMESHDIHVFVVVDRERDKIAGTLSIIIEPKFARNLAFVGHVEDVAVHIEYQGKSLGQRLIRHACEFAQSRKCYKVILDASESNGGFYEKCGFVKKETQYRFDIAEH